MESAVEGVQCEAVGKDPDRCLEHGGDRGGGHAPVGRHGSKARQKRTRPAGMETDLAETAA
eukprot:9287861-Pyramimonas_sp.AAC.1